MPSQETHLLRIDQRFTTVHPRIRRRLRPELRWIRRRILVSNHLAEVQQPSSARVEIDRGRVLRSGETEGRFAGEEGIVSDLTEAPIE